MRFSKWPYWVRGGMIGGLIPFTIFILSLFIPGLYLLFFIIGIPLMIIAQFDPLADLITDWHGDKPIFGEVDALGYMYSSDIVAIVFLYIIAGTLIGVLSDKIKNRG